MGRGRGRKVEMENKTVTLNVLNKAGTTMYISLALTFRPRHIWFPAPK